MEIAKDDMKMIPLYVVVTILTTSSLSRCASLSNLYWDKRSVAVRQGDTVNVTCFSHTAINHVKHGLRIIHKDWPDTPMWDSATATSSDDRYSVMYHTSGLMAVAQLTIRDVQRIDAGSIGCTEDSADRTVTYTTLTVSPDWQIGRARGRTNWMASTKTAAILDQLDRHGQPSDTQSKNNTDDVFEQVLGKFSDVMDEIEDELTEFQADDGYVKNRASLDVTSKNYPSNDNDVLLGLIPLPIIIIVFVVALPRCTKNRRVWRGIPSSYPQNVDLTRDSVRNRQNNRRNERMYNRSPSCPNFVQSATPPIPRPHAHARPYPRSAANMCIQPPPYTELPGAPTYVAAKGDQPLLHINLPTAGQGSPPSYASTILRSNSVEDNDDGTVSLIFQPGIGLAHPSSRPPSYTSIDINVEAQVFSNQSS